MKKLHFSLILLFIRFDFIDLVKKEISKIKKYSNLKRVDK